MRKKLFYLDLFLIFVLALYIGNWYYNNHIHEKEAEQLVKQYIELTASNPVESQPNEELSAVFEEITVDKPKHEKKINKDIIGRIQIPSIKLDYPLLAVTSNKNLKIGITKFFGADLNSQDGNTVFAGHNMRKKGVLLTDLDKLKIGSKILLYDMTGYIYSYTVFDKYIVTPDNSKPLSQHTDGESWITLISCTDWGRKRLIVQAKKD